METKSSLRMFLILALAGVVFGSSCLAQDPSDLKKMRKEMEKLKAFAHVDSLVNSRQFVFQAQYGEGSDMVFVIVDSIWCEVQVGNRNNLSGRITQFEVDRNFKKKNLTVTINMRGEMYTGDAFLFIDSSGYGKATVKSEFPGNFSFDGNLVDFKHARIYSGPSHFIH